MKKKIFILGLLVMLIVGFNTNSVTSESVENSNCISCGIYKIDGFKGIRDWWISPVTIEFYGNFKQFRIDGGEWNQTSYIAHIDEDGYYLLEWVCNDEPDVIYSKDFKIDQTPPTGNLTIEINEDELKLSVDADDNVSGIDLVYFRAFDEGIFDYTAPYSCSYEITKCFFKRKITVRATIFDNAYNRYDLEKSVVIPPKSRHLHRDFFNLLKNPNINFIILLSRLIA